MKKILPGLCFFLLVNTAIAQTEAPTLSPEQQATANKIFFEALSPYCPGRSLHDCPSESATQLKNQIKTEIVSGKSEQQIFQDLINQFGDQIRAVPEFRGFGLKLWLIPIAFVLCGLAACVLWLKSNKNPASISVQTDAAVDSAMLERIERELNR